jgi:hypothetical protein
VIKKSVCTWWLQYKKHANICYNSFNNHDNVVGIELGITDSVSVSLVSPWPWRSAGALWTLLVTFYIVIIRCTETFWSLCICVWGHRKLLKNFILQTYITAPLHNFIPCHSPSNTNNKRKKHGPSTTGEILVTTSGSSEVHWQSS